jgi:hypothetical protein
MICDKIYKVLNADFCDDDQKFLDLFFIIGSFCFIITIGLYQIYNVLLNIPILYSVVGLIGLLEILFLVDREKPKEDQSHMLFTVERKLLSLIDLAIVIGIAGDLKWVYDQLPSVAEWLGISQPYLWNLATDFAMACLYVIIIIVSIYIYIWLNSKKYDRKPRKYI